ncbi:MAG: pyridoxamine 5'-phosphate oxidase family protein, partial [Pseudomonadales bacterium]|nr:pyridoxamine 5'-phosphate oxidase family protein [Pseudomonadales bacterium]
MAPRLEDMRDCLEGIVPSCVATCDRDGMPNVTYVSQAMYVDSTHVALSFQFFNKTRQNILANPEACLLVMDPYTSARYRLAIHYMRTETSGPIFERMRAKLAGIASHEGLV